MATITIRNLDEKVKRRLQVRAALNGRSMEAEARATLAALVDDSTESATPEEDLGTAIHKRFAALGGVDLQIPPRRFSNRPASESQKNPAGKAVIARGFDPLDAEPEEDFGTAIRKLFAPLGGVELPIPQRRKSHRPIPTFD